MNLQVFGRTFNIRSLPGKAVDFIRILWGLRGVKSPLGVLVHYLEGTSPDRVNLRSGHTILLSSHPQDLATFLVIFFRGDYGKVDAGATVVDVGANIGVFALFATLSGARKVYCFEPSDEACETLRRNILLNGFEAIIEPINKAVTDRDDMYVEFPRASSPFNRLSGGSSTTAEVRLVSTVNLDSFLCSGDLSSVDLLKVDCEGAEHRIIPVLSRAALTKITRIRIEIHGVRDSRERLLESLKAEGFRIRRRNRRDMIVWLERSDQPTPDEGWS